MSDLDKIQVISNFLYKLKRGNETQSIRDEEIYLIICKLGNIPLYSLVKALQNSGKTFFVPGEVTDLLSFLKVSYRDTSGTVLTRNPNVPVAPEYYAAYLLLQSFFNDKHEVFEIAQRMKATYSANEVDFTWEQGYTHVIEKLHELRPTFHFFSQIRQIKEHLIAPMASHEKVPLKVSTQYRNHHKEYLSLWSTLATPEISTISDFSFKVPTNTFDAHIVEYMDTREEYLKTIPDVTEEMFENIRTVIIGSENLTSIEYNTQHSATGAYRELGISSDANDMAYMSVNLESGLLDLMTIGINYANEMPYIEHPYMIYSLLPGGEDFLINLENQLLYQLSSSIDEEKQLQEVQNEDYEIHTAEDTFDEQLVFEYIPFTQEKPTALTEKDKTHLQEEDIIELDGTLYQVLPLHTDQIPLRDIHSVEETISDQFLLPHHLTLRKLPKYAKAIGWREVKEILAKHFSCNITSPNKGTSHFKVTRSSDGKQYTSTILAPQRNAYAKHAKYGTIKSVLKQLHISEKVFWHTVSGEIAKNTIIHTIKSTTNTLCRTQI